MSATLAPNREEQLRRRDRLRPGSGHPRSANSQQQVGDYVLHRPCKEEQVPIEESIEKSLRALPLVFDGKFDAATMHLHTA